MEGIPYSVVFDVKADNWKTGNKRPLFMTNVNPRTAGGGGVSAPPPQADSKKKNGGDDLRATAARSAAKFAIAFQPTI